MQMVISLEQGQHQEKIQRRLMKVLLKVMHIVFYKFVMLIIINYYMYETLGVAASGQENGLTMIPRAGHLV